MYAVVGCSECSALWVIEGRPERSECPQCGTTRKFEKRKQFVTTDDPDYAREARASMLAKRQDQAEAFADLDSFAEMDEYIDEVGVDDEEYLAASGVDTDEVSDATDRLDGGTSMSRKETVMAALRELDQPAEAEVVAYATDRGVPADYVREALTKLTRRGVVSKTGSGYRLL